jgi:hypothetical protein
MVETEAAYLAGIIDGEGSISMTAAKKGTDKEYFRIVMSVSNTDKELVQWIGQWGGSFLWDRHHREGSKPQHRWTAVGNLLREILPQTIPFMIVKKDRAEWALEALAIQADRQPYQLYRPEQLRRLYELREYFDLDRRRSLSCRAREPY